MSLVRCKFVQSLYIKVCTQTCTCKFEPKKQHLARPQTRPVSYTHCHIWRAGSGVLGEVAGRRFESQLDNFHDRCAPPQSQGEIGRCTKERERGHAEQDQEGAARQGRFERLHGRSLLESTTADHPRNECHIYAHDRLPSDGSAPRLISLARQVVEDLWTTLNPPPRKRVQFAG